MLWALQERPSEQGEKEHMVSSRPGMEGGTRFQPQVFTGKRTGKSKLPGINCCWSSWKTCSSHQQTQSLGGRILLRDSTTSFRKNCTSFLLGIAGNQENNPPGFLCSQQEFRGEKRHSNRKKSNEISVRGTPSPARAECPAEDFFLWMNLHGNPSPSTEVFQDSPFLRFPWQGKWLISISWQQELSKRLLGFAKITRRKVQLISGQHYRKRGKKTEPGIKGRDEQWKSRLSWFYI